MLEHVQLLAGVGNRDTGPINAQGQHHHRQQGHLKKPHPRSEGLPTPTAAPTGVGEGEGLQGGPQAEGAVAGATHRQADLMALQPSSVWALAGNVMLLLASSASSVSALLARNWMQVCLIFYSDERLAWLTDTHGAQTSCLQISLVS